MIFTVAIILPATTGAKPASVASVMSGSTSLKRSTPALSTTTTPALSANRLARPVKARSTVHAVAGHGCRKLGGSGVFRHVARLQPRHCDRGDAGCRQRRDLGIADHGALLEHEAALADRMDDDAALGLGGSDRSELHRVFSAPSRSDAVTSPMIETAISGGDTAPIARPMGA